jgi:hypothetical protein
MSDKAKRTMMLFEASTSSELKEVLARANIAVPERTSGRTNEHMERYTVAHLVSALMKADLITYPVRLTHRDRPDFMLSMGNRHIGIEHTEAIPLNEARKAALRQRGCGPKTRFISRALPGEPRKPHEKLVEEIEANDSGEGWVGNSPQTEWADAMLHSVKDKLNAVRKDGFERFDEDWLVIYDNWPLPDPDVRKAAPLLFEAVQQTSAFEEFRCIFIMTERLFCAISPMGCIKVYETNDLWN